MKTTLIAALAAATLACAPAMAQNAATVDRTEAVSYGDLDLTRAADVRTLDRRLRSAIGRVCGPTSPSDPTSRQTVRRCRIALRERVASRRAEVLAGQAGGGPILVALEQ